MDNAVALAALTLAGTIATGFFAVINKQNKVHEKIAEAMDKVANSNVEIAKKTERVAVATETQSLESKERNGHLAELIIQQGDQMKALADSATDKILANQNVQSQHIEHAHIEHETVENKD